MHTTLTRTVSQLNFVNYIFTKSIIVKYSSTQMCMYLFVCYIQVSIRMDSKHYIDAGLVLCKNMSTFLINEVMLILSFSYRRAIKTIHISMW